MTIEDLLSFFAVTSRCDEPREIGDPGLTSHTFAISASVACFSLSLSLFRSLLSVSISLPRDTLPPFESCRAHCRRIRETFSNRVRTSCVREIEETLAQERGKRRAPPPRLPASGIARRERWTVRNRGRYEAINACPSAGTAEAERERGGERGRDRGITAKQRERFRDLEHDEVSETMCCTLVVSHRCNYYFERLFQ